MIHAECSISVDPGMPRIRGCVSVVTLAGMIRCWRVTMSLTGLVVIGVPHVVTITLAQGCSPLAGGSSQEHEKQGLSDLGN